LKALREAFGQAAAVADLIVTCGGVSVGDYDLVPQALSEVGAETMFHRLSVKPGKPVLAARLDDAWVAALPGNPVSALVGWRLFARPLAEALAGDVHAFEESPEAAVLTGPTHNQGDRTLLAPARFEPGSPVPMVTVLPWKGSHDVLTLARTNALARVDIGMELAAGDVVPCYRLD
jgi:molybdopterin molybdotransferase